MKEWISSLCIKESMCRVKEDIIMTEVEQE